MTESEGEAGFSLVEILVSFAILALALLVGLRIFGDGLARVSGDRQRLIAMDVLQTELARLDAQETIAAGESHGETNGVVWRINVAPLNEAAAGFNLRPLRVRISWENGPATAPVLETILLARSPP